MFEQSTKDLLDFIQKSPSCYHVISNFRNELKKYDFQELREEEAWQVKEGGRYFVIRGDSSIIAFKVPTRNFKGYKITASHSDSPSFKVKENPEMVIDQQYIELNVEKYGGMLYAPWFDRPLSVAGRVVVKKENWFETKLVHIDRDLLMIPNVAIHMNRQVNEGYVYNAQKDMIPLYGEASSKDSFEDCIAESIDCKKEEILGSDLFLYNRMPGSIWGANREFVSSTKLDDLQCAYSTFCGFLKEENEESVSVWCVFDNEEVGSGTKQGADSTFLEDVLERINDCCNRTKQQYKMALACSFMLSTDNAHAVHPHHLDKADPTNRPYMNKGIVIKQNANQKYTTDAVSTAIFKEICNRAKVPYQTYVNRSDIAGGSTLGNIVSAHVSIDTIDIGLAQLAMHSPYETVGMKDTYYMIEAVAMFYQIGIVKRARGMYELKD